MTPNECQNCSISAWCVNNQWFVNKLSYQLMMSDKWYVVICQCCVHNIDPQMAKNIRFLLQFIAGSNTQTSDVSNHSLGSGLKYSNSLHSVLHPPTDQIFCDDVVLIPEERSMFRWCYSGFRVQVCSRWHGLEWHLRMMFGVSVDTLGIERIICCFCLFCLLYLEQPRQCCIPIKHLRFPIRLWLLSAMNPIKHNTRATIIQT